MIFKNKRSEIEIMNTILTIARKEARKTCLLYNTNLCYNNFLEYLNFLLDKKFIEIKNINNSGNIYYVTDKGERFLNSIENVIHLTK